jgi:molecular chaperone DnaK
MGDRVDSSTKAEIESAASELKTALEGDDMDTIKTKSDALMQASHKLAEAVYQQAQQEQAASSGDGASTTQEDENVEEADYEVIDEDQNK